MATDTTEPIERWTAKRRVALVVSILKGETSVAEAARQPGLTVAELEELAREISAGRRKCAPQPTQGRRGREGCADQETETEDRGSGPGQRYFTGGVEALPFGPEDIRCVSATRPGVSERRSCRVDVSPENDDRLKLEYDGGFGGPRRKEWIDEAVTMLQYQ